MDLAEGAAAFRDLAERAESDLAMEACGEGARAYRTVLHAVTPKKTGALADSETVTGPTGGGLHATALVGPHIKYAEFRNDGGTITAKDEEARNGSKYPSGKPRRHSLAWPGGFAMHVTQDGAHYMEKAEGPGAAAVAEACAIVAERFFTL